jgi:hypothetical protein
MKAKLGRHTVILAAVLPLAAALAPLGGCVLATNGLDYNRPMMPATEGGPQSYPNGSPAFHEPVPFTYPGMAPSEQH